MIKGVLIGLVAGIVIGWALFGTQERVVYRDPGVRDRPEAPPADPDPAPERRTPEPRDDPDGPTTAALDIEGATAPELARLAAQRDLTLDAAAVEALIRRTETARADRDWHEFRSLLTLLGRSGARSAQEKLVELMGDPSLNMQGRMGRHFFTWLDQASVPGIVGAARARIESEARVNPGTAYDGWLALVARHGGPADLAWLDELVGKKASARAAVDAYVAAAGRPEAANRLAELFEKRKKPWFPSRWRNLAAANPVLTRSLVESGFATASRYERDHLAGAYGHAVDKESLPHARRFLLGLRGEDERISAVAAVQRMARNGLETRGFEAITAAPVAALENIATNPKANPRAFYRALSTIRNNPVTWSPRAVAALEAAAQHADDKTKLALRTAAAKVRQGLGQGDWK